MKIPMALWPRLMPLLDEALAQPADEREAWLQRQNLDDDTAAALRQLLADRQELDGGDFMAALPKLEPVPAASASDVDRNGGGQSAQSNQSGLFAGDMLGPYRLIRPLGQGGMSVVWLAERDDGQIRRQVALKMPHAGPGQALLAERLRRERDILASLEHRHIARLYDVGTAPQGLPFMVLEYIEGQPLPAYCDAHQLNIHERLNLFLQVLSAVQYAHTKLVLHRDLKPSNILVNEQGEVKLLDFGIAKLIQGSETGAVAASTELTQHNGHVLTPDYAAPEQIAGKPLTTASDVYALGVILFELLTGQRPYRLPRGTRGALEEAILATDPRRPSQVWLDADVQTHHPTAVTLSDLAGHFHTSARRLHQLLKGDLDVIVLTALQKQTARRYATAEAFAQDIQHHLAKEPIAAQPDSRWYRTRKYVQRHAWALSAVGAVMAALSVGLGVALWQAKEARQEAAKANAIKDFLVGLFENGDVEQPDALRKRQQTVEQLLVNSARALGTQLKDQPQVRVELQGVVGGLLHNLAITDEAIALRKQRVAQLEALGAPVAEQAQALRELADSQDARGDTAGAKATLQKGLALCRLAQMRPVEVCYGLQVARGQVAVIARDIGGAESHITPAYEFFQRWGRDCPQWAEALVAQGDLLSLKNDSKTSFELYEQAMNIRARLWGARSIRLAQERYALALSLTQVGRIEQGFKEMNAAYQVLLAALGLEHRNTAIVEIQLGLLQTYIGVRKGGREHVEHAARILFAQESSIDSRALYDAHSALAKVALYDGHLQGVGRHLEIAEQLQASLEGRLPNSGYLETAKAWYLDDIGQPGQARSVLRKARERLLPELGEGHPYVQTIDDAIGASYLTEKNLDGARRHFDSYRSTQAWNMVEQSLGWTAYLMASGRYEAARPLVEARFEKMKASPRGNQYRTSVFSAYEQMGRLYMGLEKPTVAARYFEEATQILSTGYLCSPYLLATRARYGLALIAAGDTRGAARHASLVWGRCRDGGELAPQFMEPIKELMQRTQEGR